MFPIEAAWAASVALDPHPLWVRAAEWVLCVVALLMCVGCAVAARRVHLEDKRNAHEWETCDVAEGYECLRWQTRCRKCGTACIHKFDYPDYY